VRAIVDPQVISLIEKLKKRYGKTPKHPLFNWPENLFTRWHRDALYFVVVMRTPHVRPPTFETHAARMEHAGAGKFNLAVPMRKGWNTIRKQASPEEYVEAISERVCF
jgi:hypothetical protein